ncbi:MAG: SDR family oxidoreductase UcpA [Deltaproteobacteria bacterium]|nr:SDR family oxidoreductase UcpA [Deltaproteobacteria bacterium]
MGRLENKVAIVTGAAMGNGWGIAKIFAQEGAQVVMLDINDKVFESAKELDATAFKVDIRNYSAVKKAVDETAQKFGKIDILVNNAGVAKLEPFLDMSDETRDFHFGVNINGAWNCTKAAMPYMVEKNYGKIVNLSSVTGTMVADAGESAYATTKAAIWGFTKALAIEFVGNNVNVNMICPGMIRTPMLENAAANIAPDNPEVVIDAIASTVPMKRLGKPEEIGQLAAFLASDEAAYITGQPFVIDGGSTLPETAGAIE